MSSRDSDLMAFYEQAVAKGIPFKKPGNYIKFSSTIHEDSLRNFRSLTDRLGYKVQDALTEAVDLWVAQRSLKK